MSCNIACNIQKTALECYKSCNIATLIVTLNVTPQTLVNTGFLGICNIVTFISINDENRENRELRHTQSSLKRLIRVIIHAMLHPNVTRRFFLCLKAR